ncbi:MAG TPA: decaprenyl-phosphate phosphoribosyltransferase [Armatimonadota bacterium]
MSLLSSPTETRPAEERTGQYQSLATVRDWWRLLRPRQWIKNFVVFAGLLFTGSFTVQALLLTGSVFLAFCALSSAGYLVNDTLDAPRDRAHPRKRERPIAAGRIRPGAALTVAVLLGVGGIVGIAALNFRVALLGLAYLALTFSYSFIWKHMVILDVVALAVALILRAFAGTAILHIALSPWLLVCLWLLALMLGFGKRRHELCLIDVAPHDQRPVLAQYTCQFLDQASTAVLGAALVSYAVYAIMSPTAQKHPSLVYTVPLVGYGMLRYLYLVHVAKEGGQPEEIFLTDRPIIVTAILWALLVVGIFLWV